MPNPLTAEERARLVEDLRDIHAIMHNSTAVRAIAAQAAAELARTADDARDAERYRWLRKHVKPWEGFDAGYPYCEIDIFLRELANGSVEKISIIGPHDAVGMASLDTAVDIALASSKSEAAEGGEDG